MESSPCQNTVMNTDPFSSIMAAAVTITTSFAAYNSSRDTVTENIYSVEINSHANTHCFGNKFRIVPSTE